MADLLRQGAQWLEQQRTTCCSSPVAYRRPPDSVTVNATYGKTDVEMADESGLTVRSHVTDFLILASELGFGPKQGDQIVADGRVYEVIYLAGEGPWRWSDPYRTTFRIHTKDTTPQSEP
ncbi:hypothetical protein [Mucisphaera calidilacus]|uniref:Phage head-tail joining protein domain-containing protein n=1 Tax=Mucisphaera calidilacus TaxID=2527982 RepID=A0A518BVT2_9BACT|nr:hypothetical protein [Mucisphaera calidilacus]QDU71044.1 hypothetical protein Pan265_08890 [Mucisphaera calidilacus]